MKKQFVAAAVAATFGFGVSAADVEIYGSVDLGMSVAHSTKTGTASSTTTTMNSSISGPSRWGMKGSEDFGNGYGVAFKLEAPLDADTGYSFGSGKTIGFKRESRVSVLTPYGEFAFGRMGGLNSSAGTYEILALHADVYDGGWDSGTIGGHPYYFETGRLDNAVTYVSPTLAGLTAYLQYSNQVDSSWDGVEGKSSTERFYAVGMTYQNGPLTLVGTFESALHRGSLDSSKILSLGGNYQFPACTLYAVAQYGDNLCFNRDEVTGQPVADGVQSDVRAFSVGMAIPCFGGTVKASTNYGWYESNESASKKTKDAGVSATFEYPFSKRTTGYVGAGYQQSKTEGIKSTDTQFVFGLNHSF